MLSFAAAPNLSAETPPDQIKAAGAIPLNEALFNKMDEFVKAVGQDAGARAEMAEINKDPSIGPENWGSTINAKCPKTVALLKDAGLTADEFSKGIFAIMAIGLSEGLDKSTDKTVKANAEFIAANQERAGNLFGAFMALGEPAAKP